METIKVNLGNRSYDIDIDKNLLGRIDFRRFNAGKYAIVTDSNVEKLYGEELQKSLMEQGLDIKLFSFQAGETSKTLETASDIGRKLARAEFDRDSLIIALGGGVVGDLAGFIASFYKRGINFVQVPTTLVAQVDSSIGGKTGIDIPEGKNMFGYFYQPKAVFTDISTLKTLPEKEIKNGLAEIIKYCVIKDSELFDYIEQNNLKRDEEFYLSVVEKSCKIKARIVEQDEREGELRKILNYGHTIGHAIESAEEYRGITHGQAIALGMVYEGKISARLGLLKGEELERQNNLIGAVDLPTKYEGSIDKLIEIMRRDKKNKNGKIYFILPAKIGGVKEEDGKISFPVEESIVRECLKD